MLPGDGYGARSLDINPPYQSGATTNDAPIPAQHGDTMELPPVQPGLEDSTAITQQAFPTWAPGAAILDLQEKSRPQQAQRARSPLNSLEPGVEVQPGMFSTPPTHRNLALLPRPWVACGGTSCPPPAPSTYRMHRVALVYGALKICPQLIEGNDLKRNTQNRDVSAKVGH